MTTRRPSSTPALSPATGVAGGSLGTGTAVDDDTKTYEVPAIAWRPSGPSNVRTSQSASVSTETPSPGPVAPVERVAQHEPARAGASPVVSDPGNAAPAAARQAPVPASASEPGSRRVAPSRADPFRPIGIALAAMLVALAGIAVLSSGGDAPIEAGAPPFATETPGQAGTGNATDGDANGGGAGDGGNDGGGNNGGGPGNGNGNRGGGPGNGNGNGPGGNNGRGND